MRASVERIAGSKEEGRSRGRTGRTENQYHLGDCKRACVRACVQPTWRETPFPQSRMPASIENFNKASCLVANALRKRFSMLAEVGRKAGASSPKSRACSGSLRTVSSMLCDSSVTTKQLDDNYFTILHIISYQYSITSSLLDMTFYYFTITTQSLLHHYFTITS